MTISILSIAVLILSLAVIFFAACAVAAHIRIDRLRRDTADDLDTVVSGVNLLHDHVCPCTTVETDKDDRA